VCLHLLLDFTEETLRLRRLRDSLSFRSLVRTPFVFVAFAFASSLAGAQSPVGAKGHIAGRVIDDRSPSPTPVAFGMVLLLLSTDTSASPLAVALTGEDGTFSIAYSAEGHFYLSIRRLGYGIDAPVPINIDARSSIDVVIVSHAQPIRLPSIRVSDGCLTQATIAQNPAAATLWSEARKTMLARRTFLESYRFFRDEHTLNESFDRDASSTVTDTTYTSDPIRIRQENRANDSKLSTGGLRRENQKVVVTIRTPNEATLLDPEFLTRYCLLEETQEDTDGNILVRIQPVGSAAKNEMTVRGTIAFDTVSYGPVLMRYSYYLNGNIVGNVSVTYGEIRVGKQTFRLPKEWRVEFVDPKSRAPRLRWTSAIRYRAFDRQ
jgi:hypothetical protein